MAFVVGQPQGFCKCMKKVGIAYGISRLRLSYHCSRDMALQISVTRQRRDSFSLFCQSSSNFEQQSICFRWLQDFRNIFTLLVVGSFIPSPLSQICNATAFPLPNTQSLEERGNQLPILETTEWHDSIAQDSTALQSLENWSFNSQRFPLYPSLALDCSSIEHGNLEKVTREDMLEMRRANGKFPWNAWYRVEDSESVNKEETVRSEKKGRYVFVIVTLLVIACVVPMIQYYSYTRDK